MRLQPITRHIIADEKALEFDQAPFGITGLETAVGLAFDLVHAGLIDLERMVEMCSANPARIFGLNRSWNSQSQCSCGHHDSRSSTGMGFRCEEIEIEEPEHAVSRALDVRRGGRDDRWRPSRLSPSRLHSHQRTQTARRISLKVDCTR